MSSFGARSRTWFGFVALLGTSAAVAATSPLLAGGITLASSRYLGVPYLGSVEKPVQQAIIIYHGGRRPGEASEDVILQVRVEGEVENFAWVIPFPHKPKVVQEDPRLFDELSRYVRARRRPRRKSESGTRFNAASGTPAAETVNRPVDVLWRETVGKFDVAVIRENEPGELNNWLVAEKYRPLSRTDDLLAFYREKGYVFACLKVSNTGLERKSPAELHPLRFSFKTGGRDGIYFPMKLNGLQETPFDVNLYVFYRAWLNDDRSKFGYVHRGFRLKYRDWDTSACKPTAGKMYSAPHRDVFLKDFAKKLPTVTRLFQKLHPGQRYYLTNIEATGLRPKVVRNWSDDLWLFPYYTGADFVPYDVRPGGPASAAWPNAIPAPSGGPLETGTIAAWVAAHPWLLAATGTGIGALVGLFVGVGIVRGSTARKKSRSDEPR